MTYSSGGCRRSPTTASSLKQCACMYDPNKPSRILPKGLRMQARPRRLQAKGLCSTPARMLLVLVSCTDLVLYRSPGPLADTAHHHMRPEGGLHHTRPEGCLCAGRPAVLPRMQEQSRVRVPQSPGTPNLAQQRGMRKCGSPCRLAVTLQYTSQPPCKGAQLSARPPTGAPAFAGRAEHGVA